MNSDTANRTNQINNLITAYNDSRQPPTTTDTAHVIPTLLSSDEIPKAMSNLDPLLDAEFAKVSREDLIRILVSYRRDFYAERQELKKYKATMPATAAGPWQDCPPPRTDDDTQTLYLVEIDPKGPGDVGFIELAWWFLDEWISETRGDPARYAELFPKHEEIKK